MLLNKYLLLYKYAYFIDFDTDQGKTFFFITICSLRMAINFL